MRDSNTAMPTLANWRTPPFNRRSFGRVREIIPTANIVADPRAAQPLQRRARGLTSFEFRAPGGEFDVACPLSRSLGERCADRHAARQDRARVVSHGRRAEPTAYRVLGVEVADGTAGGRARRGWRARCGSAGHHLHPRTDRLGLRRRDGPPSPRHDGVGRLHRGLSQSRSDVPALSRGLRLEPAHRQ